MKKLIALSIVTCMLAMETSCNKEGGSTASSSSSSAGAVAVVDLDRVGKTMGWTDEIQKSLQTTDAEVRKQLDARVSGARNALEQKKKDVAEQAKLSKDQTDALNKPINRQDMEKMGLTAAQIDELFQASNAYSQELNGARNAYQQLMTQRRTVIVAAYREAVAPVVRRVANSNGRSIVLSPSPELLYYDPASDLTDKVIDELQKMPQIKPQLPEMPSLQAPTTQSATTAPSPAPNGTGPTTQGH